jgi:tetratricopeptide (TPR) repeat protein
MFMMRILFLLLIGFIVTGLSAQEDLTEEDLAQERLLIEAQKSILLEKYDDAMEVLDKMYQDDRQNPTVLWAISRVHLGRKDLDLAETAIREALKFDGQNKYYLEHLAEVLKRTRDLNALAETYEKLYRIEPDNEEYAFEWVRYLDQTKDYKRAIKALESMEKRDFDPRISYRKARIWEKSGAPKRAEREYKKLIALEPENVRHYHLLANHYQEQRNQSGAMEVYKEILKIDPDDSRASLALANQLRSSGKDAMYLKSIRKVIESPSIGIDVKVKEILPFIQKLTTARDPEVEGILSEYASTIVGLHPEEAKAYALMADMYNLTDQRDLAIAAYQGALQRDKTVYSVWEQYLYLLAAKGDYPTLGKEAEKALDFFPNRGRLFYFSALALHALEDLDDAMSELEMAQMMVGKDIVLQFDIARLKGRVARKLGQTEQSIARFEEALKINGNDADLLSDMAMALADQARDLDRATEYAEKALAQDQDYLPAIMATSWVEAKKGDTSGAIARLQGIAAGSSNAGLLEVYGDILFLAEREDEAVEYWQKALEIIGQSDRLSLKIKEKKITTSGL